MNLKGHILLIAFSILAFASNAQDGEGLFKSKCSMCHMLGKDGTGPDLNGVKQKWEDAGEGDFLYEWMTNSTELISSGKSKVAVTSGEYSAISMPPQTLSNEEVDAILAYVDAYAPAPKPEPVATTDVAPTTEKEVVYVANYNKNIKLFYWLIIALGVQFMAILMISNSLKSLISMKQKLGDNAKAIIALVGLFGIMAVNNTSHALSFMKPGMAEENAPWLIVEDFDITAMVILNVILLFVLLHFKKTFMDINASLRPNSNVVVSKDGKVTKRKEKKLNDILTGAVDIEEEHTILMHHEYDGIKELDNNLPPWWVWMFYMTIIFAVVYLSVYHIFGSADTQIEEYEHSMAYENELVQKYRAENNMLIDASNVELITDKAELDKGKVIFETNCAVCHNPNGEGNIGPNLTDAAWIYGFDISEVFTTIKDGTTKGMPEHASKLNPAQLQQVSSFVLNLQEFDGGKAPEGDKMEAGNSSVVTEKATLLTSEADLSAGKDIFNVNCVVCHMSNGEGSIGPNLTDKAWVYGFDISDVLNVIKNGTEKGMPEHGSRFDQTELEQVSSYVLSLPPFDGGKAPEGDKVEL